MLPDTIIAEKISILLYDKKFNLFQALKSFTKLYKWFFSFIINYIYCLLRLGYVFTRRRFFLGILFIAIFITGAKAAILHGTIYGWSDFDNPLKNVIVEIDENSTRVQYMVSPTGEYNFTLSPGNYSIKAKYYRDMTLELTGEEKIQIENADESKEFDLLLFPPADSEYLGDINLTSSLDKNETNPNYYIVIILILAFSGLMITYWIMKKKNTKIESINRNELPEKLQTDGKELPEDLRNLYDVILKMGGRTTQKDLRKKIAYSEAKVSLMLDDLEDRGLIKKIKKGRSNIIIAEGQK